MSGDLAPVPTEHSADILGNNYPEHSETAYVKTCIQQLEQAAASVGTGDVAEVMAALIEAHSTGHTPEELLAGFTADQRAAFNNALTQVNQSQSLSVAAADLFNTKVSMNGVVMGFEAAVKELIAEGAAGTLSQSELQDRYNQLLDQAKSQVSSLKSNHDATKDALAAGFGGTPEVPATTNAGDGTTVPGLPADSLGSLMTAVSGVMSKPPNLPFPNLQQYAQPAMQAMQKGLGELLKSGKGDGVSVDNAALTKLVNNVAANSERPTLSGPDKAKDGKDSTAMGGGPGRGLRSPLTAG
ncbi:MAG: hypothetical protein WAV90_04050, partial [Gordonia amarae]